VFLVVVGDARCPAHHVAVCIQINKDAENRWYLDANGVSSQEALLRYWRDEEGLDEPFLIPYDEQLLQELGIPSEGRMSTRLADCFFGEFGRFSPTWLDEQPAEEEAFDERTKLTPDERIAYAQSALVTLSEKWLQQVFGQAVERCLLMR
jgi:hypothetical protein